MSDTAILLWFLGILVVAVLSPFLFDAIDKRVSNYGFKRFCRNHPDWVEANDAFQKSADQGARLQNELKTTKKAIDTINEQYNYLPQWALSDLSDMLAEQKEIYYKLLDKLKEHNQEHEKLRLHCEELSKKYKRYRV